MRTTAEAVIFAINAAIRLARNTQQAYAKSLKSRAIVLPLPRFQMNGISKTLARKFFNNPDEREGGKQFLTQFERLQKLHQRSRPISPDPLTDEEWKEYTAYYERFYKTLHAGVAGELPENQVNAEELAALLRIRQWERGQEPATRPLQMVAGTLVEIGIDYFNQVPGALNRQSTLGKAMTHFLAAIDSIPFADQDRLRRHSPRIVPQLFIAAAEAISDLSPDLRADPKIQAFIQSATQGIAQDLFERLEGLSSAEEEKTIRWSGILLRSVVANAGSYVFEGPQRLFDLNDAAATLVRETGLVLLEAILEDPDQIDLQAGLSSQNLDALIQTAFTVVAQYPTLLNGRRGFREIVIGVSGALAQTSFRRPDYLPEIVRLILLHTATNLPQIWREQGDGIQNLLLLAAREILFALSEDNTSNWRPVFSRDQLVALVDTLLAATAANPHWITNEVRGHSLLREVIRVVIQGLAAAPPNQRFSAENFRIVLDLVTGAVATNPALLGTINWTTDSEEVIVLESGLSLIIGAAFEQGNTSQEKTLFLLRYALRAILGPFPDQRGLVLIRLMLSGALEPGPDGIPNEFALDELIELGLKVLATHPELLTDDTTLATIIEQLSRQLSITRFNSNDWLPQLLRIALRVTAANSSLILSVTDSTGNQSPTRFLAAEALADALRALSGIENIGPWRPQLSPERLIATVELLLERVVQDHDWLLQIHGEDSLWKAVIEAIMDSLSLLQVGARVSQQALELIIWRGLRAVAANNQLLTVINWTNDDHERKLLSHFIDLVVTFAYPESSSGPERTVLLENILHFTMEDVVSQYPNRRGLILLNLILNSYQYRHDRPFDREQLAELLDVFLAITAANPHLLSGAANLDDIIEDLAASLGAANLPLDRFLPELLRRSLQLTGENIALLLGHTADSPRTILALALEQSLMAITRTATPNGQWQAGITEADILDLITTVLEEVSQYPDWINGAAIEVTLTAVFEGIENASLLRPLPPSSILLLVREAMRAVRFRRQLVLQITNEDDSTNQELILTFSLRELLISLHGPNALPAASWTLGQGDFFAAIVTTFLTRLAHGPAAEGLIRQMINQIDLAAYQLEQNLEWTLADLISRLQQL